MSDEQFTPTHRVPPTGMPTWNEPDPNRAADNRLPPDLAVLGATVMAAGALLSPRAGTPLARSA